MTVEFIDRQDQCNTANGTKIDNDGDLSRLLGSFTDRKPFFCELLSDKGYKQLIGIGGSIGCVQHSPTDGSPPYLMAVADVGQITEPEVEFLMADTVTPISRHYCMPLEKVIQIATYFLKTGGYDPSVGWEEI